jgi:hypothetical protein
VHCEARRPEYLPLAWYMKALKSCAKVNEAF